MILVFYLLAAIVLSISLVKSAGGIIASASKLARHLKLSEYTVSFMIVALATSLPELVVGIVAALDNNSELSYGNVLGSNIADITIILAIPILIGGAIKTKEIVKNHDLLFTGFFGVLPIILMLDGTLSKLDGLVLILSYAFYLIIVFRRSTSLEKFIGRFSNTNVYKELVTFLVSIALLLLSANFLVVVAKNISYLAHIPMIMIGLFVTAIGTSLPELVFGLKAIKTRHKGEVIGNIVGSVVANSTLVLGITALINPIQRDGNVGITSVGFLLLTILLFILFSINDKSLGKVEALFLIFVYFAFIVVEQLVAI